MSYMHYVWLTSLSLKCFSFSLMDKHECVHHTTSYVWAEFSNKTQMHTKIMSMHKHDTWNPPHWNTYKHILNTYRYRAQTSIRWNVRPKPFSIIPSWRSVFCLTQHTNKHKHSIRIIDVRQESCMTHTPHYTQVHAHTHTHTRTLEHHWYTLHFLKKTRNSILYVLCFFVLHIRLLLSWIPVKIE